MFNFIHFQQTLVNLCQQPRKPARVENEIHFIAMWQIKTHVLFR
jgi:hypothetical protein